VSYVKSITLYNVQHICITLWHSFCLHLASCQYRGHEYYYYILWHNVCKHSHWVFPNHARLFVVVQTFPPISKCNLTDKNIHNLASLYYLYCSVPRTHRWVKIVGPYPMWSDSRCKRNDEVYIDSLICSIY